MLPGIGLVQFSRIILIIRQLYGYIGTGIGFVCRYNLICKLIRKFFVPVLRIYCYMCSLQRSILPTCIFHLYIRLLLHFFHKRVLIFYIFRKTALHRHCTDSFLRYQVIKSPHTNHDQRRRCYINDNPQNSLLHTSTFPPVRACTVL